MWNFLCKKNVLPICDDNKQRFFYQIGAIDFCLSKIKRLFEKQGVSDILNECGYVNVEIIKDLAGMDRVVKAYKSSRHIEGE